MRMMRMLSSCRKTRGELFVGGREWCDGRRLAATHSCRPSYVILGGGGHMWLLVGVESYTTVPIESETEVSRLRPELGRVESMNTLVRNRNVFLARIITKYEVQCFWFPNFNPKCYVGLHACFITVTSLAEPTCFPFNLLRQCMAIPFCFNNNKEILVFL